MRQPDLTPPKEMLAAWEKSRVVHRSIDEQAEAAVDTEEDQEEEEEEEEDSEEQQNENGDEEDPDRILHNCRPATDQDALLTFEELRELYKSLHAEGGLSLYGNQVIPGEEDNTFGTRWTEQTGGWPRPEGRQGLGQTPGDWEPKYTNVTPLWRCTLDYIVVYPAVGASQGVQVTSLLKVPRLEELE